MRLVLVFVAFVGSVAGSFYYFSFICDSGVSSRVAILSRLFTGNNLLLKLLRIFPLAVNNDKSFVFVPFSKFLNSNKR